MVLGIKHFLCITDNMVAHGGGITRVGSGCPPHPSWTALVSLAAWRVHTSIMYSLAGSLAAWQPGDIKESGNTTVVVQIC